MTVINIHTDDTLCELRNTQENLICRAHVLTKAVLETCEDANRDLFFELVHNLEKTTDDLRQATENLARYYNSQRVMS